MPQIKSRFKSFNQIAYQFTQQWRSTRNEYMQTTVEGCQFTMDARNNPQTLKIEIPDATPYGSNSNILFSCFKHINEQTLAMDDFDEINYGMICQTGEPNWATETVTVPLTVNMFWELIR